LIQVPRIRENYHRVPRIRENRVPARYITFFLKKPCIYLNTLRAGVRYICT